MKTSEKSVTVTTPRGNQIVVTAVSVRGNEMKEEVSYCDGDNVIIDRRVETKKDTLTLCFLSDGMTLTGYITTYRSAGQPESYGYFISNNNKCLPLNEECYIAIENCQNAAMNEAEMDESYAELINTREVAERVEKEYQSHVNSVNNMMTLNNNTY